MWYKSHVSTKLMHMLNSFISLSFIVCMCICMYASVFSPTILHLPHHFVAFLYFCIFLRIEYYHCATHLYTWPTTMFLYKNDIQKFCVHVFVSIHLHVHILHPSVQNKWTKKKMNQKRFCLSERQMYLTGALQSSFNFHAPN